MRHISKLGLKLVAIVLVLIFIPLALSYWVTQNGTRGILEAKIKVITTKATDAAYEELERFLVEAEDLTEEIAASDTVDLFLTGMGDFVKTDLEQIKAKNPWISSFAIIAEDGTYVNYPEVTESTETDWRNKLWYSRTKEDDQLSWFPALNRSDQFRLAVPVRFSYSDEIAGVFSLVLDMKQFTTILQQYGVDDGSMLLINSTGAVLASDKSSEVDDELFDQQEFFAKTFESDELLFDVYSYAGEKRLTFTKPLPKLKSVLLLQIPERVAYQDVYGLLGSLRLIGIVTCFIVLIVTILVTHFWITGKILRVVKAAGAISEGDLREQINVNSTDEIGKLARSFNGMTSGLRDLINDILQSSEQVSRTSEQIHESAEMSAQISDQVAVSIQQVAAGADKQSEFIDSVNQKLVGLSKSIDGLSNTSKNVQGIARNTQSKADLGARSMERVVGQMDVIQQSITDSTQVILDMTKAADEIGNFVNIIDSIANQTNLLALNAAIEAARAGEEGRGFAVVAGEIRTLAEEVSVSAGKIRQLVNITQDYSHKASSAMEDGVTQIQFGQEIVNESGTIFSEIFQSFEDTLKAVQAMDEMTSDVAQSTGLIVEGAENIAEVAEENAASAEEVSASTEEQAAAMEEITRLAETTANLSKDLEILVQRFKV